MSLLDLCRCKTGPRPRLAITTQTRSPFARVLACRPLAPPSVGSRRAAGSGERFRILAQECRQRLLEIARRDAPQVEHRQRCVQAVRAPCPQRQYRRNEANSLAIAGRRAIPNLHPGDLDCADPVWIVRAEPWPCRIRRSRPSGSFRPFIAAINAASTSTACASSCCAPDHKIFVSGSSISSGRAGSGNLHRTISGVSA
jgi:hypothetical protein